MAGGKKDKEKKGPQGGNSGFMDGVVILDLEDFDDEGNLIGSVPAARNSAGNESGMHGNPQSNESARQEEEHKKKNPGSVKDHNSGPPQNRDELNEDDILQEEIDEVGFELDRDLMGDQIISNRMPRNVLEKVKALRQRKNAGGNQGGGQAQPPQQAPVQVPQQAPQGIRQAEESQLPPVQGPQLGPGQIAGFPAPNLNSDEDMVVEAPDRKISKKKKNGQPQNIQNDESGPVIEGLNQIHYDPFKPQQKPRSEWSKTAQANNLLWRGVGNTLGKASVFPASLVGKALYITGGIKHAAHKKAEKGQQTRDHRAIPGREGVNFNPNKNTGKDILADFRRVPTVWSYLTAGKAADNFGTDVPPKVTVYVEQPKTGSSRSMYFREMGHTMLGIEYTRFSKITGHKERYNIKYGFYPAGGFANQAGTAMMLRGAIVPGQLMDDATHDYDISKTYPASTEQIERIAKASEAYTEQGGYGYFTRNCTTFVRDMFRAGGIATDAVDRIFTEEKVRFNSFGHTGLVFANAWNGFYDTDLQRKMGNLTKKNDHSYQGQGNKRVTKEDFDRYRATKNTSGFGQTGLAPASAGENMRRMTDSEGQVGSYRYAPAALKKDQKDDATNASAANLIQLRNAIQAEGVALYNKINTIMSEEQIRTAGIDFFGWVMNLMGVGSAIATLDRARLDKLRGMSEQDAADAALYELLTPKQVKDAHAGISDEMAEISKQYQTALGSDHRVNTEVMNLLSTMQIALRMLDKLYKEQDKSSARGDLGTLRENMTALAYTVKVGDNLEVMMTPTHYESYLQIYKTPEAAVRAYQRFRELQVERDGHDSNLKTWKNPKKWSSKKLDEWNRLSRNEELARQYDQSHRDMLNKDGFPQADIDYAFRLRKMEQSGNVKATGDMYSDYASAAMTYIAIFFEKIFGGMRDTAKRDPKSGGIPKDADVQIGAMWLNDYLTRRTQTKMKGMAAILRGIMHVYNHPTRELIKGSFRIFLMNAYLKRVFPGTRGHGSKIQEFGMGLEPIYSAVIDNPQMSFTKTIDSLINLLMLEHQNSVDAKEQEQLRQEMEKQAKKKKKKK